MGYPTSDEIRSTFLEFFRTRGGGGEGHAIVPSSPVVPHEDPTLLFTNAGMNQFKPLFLGTVDPSSPLAGLRRAADTQKCIRAGGKHNDLEDVGKDTYHHTFFEMLGNWSFGDYFKAEAIDWAWELLTGVFGIPADRLYATYFGGEPESGLEPDLETKELWLKHLPAARVIPGSMKDNFWEMGDTGPCGPCSEIHYDRIGDRDASALVNRDDPSVLEVWNLVFIQFDRQGPTSLRPLPAKHVDTGMGLERLTSVLQHVTSNYDTDLFAPIFASIERHTAAPRAYMGYVGEKDVGNVDTAYRVIADHVRTLSFAIADGATPSNEGRGYVLRRVLRRAVRYGRQMLGARTGFLSQIVPSVVGKMGHAFPELAKHEDRIVRIIAEEEESFGRTLDRGIKQFEEAAGRASEGRITGEDAFQLYDTYGFPLDLTQLMAEERGLGVDVAGFEACMEAQRERSRAAGGGDEAARLALPADAVVRLRHMKVEPTQDADKYHGRPVLADVKAIWNGHDFDVHVRDTSGGTRPVAIILNKTNLYAEAGGQVGDHGRIVVMREDRSSASDLHKGGEFRVQSVASDGGYVLHEGVCLRGEIRVGDRVEVRVDKPTREPTMANHTATHMLNFALREVLGEGVEQKGSLVEPERLRFDFSHTKPMTPEELETAESMVRASIERDLTVYTDIVPLNVARQITGVRAVFGETYPDPVRVVSIGQPVSELTDSPENPAWREVSVEFCGGTHLGSTSEAGAFAIVSETGIAKGVRRIEAVTGAAARAAAEAGDRVAADIEAAVALEGEALEAEVASLNAEIDALTLSVVRRAQLRNELLGLQERAKAARKERARTRAAAAAAAAAHIARAAQESGDEVIVASIEAGSDRGALQQALKTIQDTCPRAAVMLLSADESDPESPKVAVIAGVPKVLVDRGLRAGDWVREASEALGGKGGGRPDQAQGGGREVGKVREAIEVARQHALRRVMG